MEQTNQIQKECGATWIDLMTPDQLQQKFPWINTSGISLGSYGTEREGYFDPWSLLSAMKNKVEIILFFSFFHPKDFFFLFSSSS